MRKKVEKGIEEIVKPLGIVFGYIGTSPIYTFTAVLFFLRSQGDISETTIYGVISLIAWSLVIIVYIQYTWLAMNLSIRGEGGTIILQEILVPMLKKKRQISIAITISLIALAFIMGDGVITPAITILSAVEGLVLVPGLDHIHTDNRLWKAYAVIKHISPSIVQFYNMPPQKLHGVVTLVTI